MITGRIKRQIESASCLGDTWKISFLERNGEIYQFHADMVFLLTEKEETLESFYLFVAFVTITKGAHGLCGDMVRLIGGFLFPSKYVWKTSFEIVLHDYPRSPLNFFLLRKPVEEPIQISSLFNSQGQLNFYDQNTDPSSPPLSLGECLKKLTEWAEQYDEKKQPIFQPQ